MGAANHQYRYYVSTQGGSCRPGFIECQKFYVTLMGNQPITATAHPVEVSSFENKDCSSFTVDYCWGTTLA
jgi:hypothetical protein